ncbi:hypothetical protein AU210_009499 [Fusarium oxysporum f. sp. radicis-cucumerinum]|uniref:Uncharacterized protein n=1 Tax=Fusarium oxysporum f. sp. radicis-cucumerinum TaxID=327505 RepID=A0A2H3GRS3_FUSOX|nr:hypothetical protein AU210_009499 [Fusarium oxysporum f. sp. radicis-cucumerinum]
MDKGLASNDQQWSLQGLSVFDQRSRAVVLEYGSFGSYNKYRKGVAELLWDDTCFGSVETSLPSLRSLELRFSTFSSPYSLPPLLLDMRQRLGWGKRPVAMRPKVTFVWAGPTRLEGQIVKHVSYDLVDITDITELDEFEPAHERLNFSGTSQQQIRRAGWQAIYNGKVKNGLSSLECTQVLEIRDQRRSGNASIADCEHMFMILR